MAIDVTLLKTRAECEQAESAYDERTEVLNKRRSDIAYSSKVATDRAQGYADELTDLNANIAAADLAIPTLTPGGQRRIDRENERRRDDDRRGEVQAQQLAAGGVAAVLRQSELKETDGRIASLAEDKATVVAHKDTLAN